MPATTPISHRKCTGGFWSAEPPIFYNGKWGMWRAHFIEDPWPNFCHGPSSFMILSHISSIENFSMKKCVFLVGYYLVDSSSPQLAACTLSAIGERRLLSRLHFGLVVSLRRRRRQSGKRRRNWIFVSAILISGSHKKRRLAYYAVYRGPRLVEL